MPYSEDKVTADYDIDDEGEVVELDFGTPLLAVIGPIAVVGIIIIGIIVAIR